MTDALPSANDSLTGNPLLDLWPVFVPASFFAENNWPGPHTRCTVPGLGLTWAVLSDRILTYLNYEKASAWDLQGVRWRDQALENVRGVAAQAPYTHEFRNGAGDLYAVAVIPEDGVGPSRLLEGDYRSLFPSGYLVGLPEMSCGLVVSATATPEEMAKIEDIAQHCFEHGTRPLVPGLHDPEGLAPVP